MNSETFHECIHMSQCIAFLFVSSSFRDTSRKISRRLNKDDKVAKLPIKDFMLSPGPLRLRHEERTRIQPGMEQEWTRIGPRMKQDWIRMDLQ